MAERTPLMRDGRDGGRRTLDPDKITLSDSIRPVGGFRGDSKRTDGSRFSAIAKTCSLKLFFWALLAIVSGVGQSIYLALTLTKVMPSYPYWVFAWTVIPFVLVFLVVLLFFQFATNQITPEMRQLSHKKWFFIGFATMLNGVFLLFAGPHVDGQLQALLGPTVVIVPMSMACSFIYLRRRYSIGQVIGVIIILSGIVVAVLPQLLSSSPSSGSGSGSGGGSDSGSGLPSNVTASGSGGGDSSTSGSIFWDIMFVAGSLPSAMMASYEEKAFEDHPIHMAHLMFWSTCYQMITIFLIGGPLSLIKGFGVAGPSEFFAHQAQGFNCFVGIDPPIEDCPDCNCAYAPAFVTLFTVMYILTNYANLGVVKYGNATLSFIVTTVVTPLSFFAYTQVWLVGNPDFTATVPLTGVISLGILMVGVVVYRVFDRSSHPADELVDATVDFRPGAEDDEFITRTVTPISAYMGAGTTQVIRVRKGTMRSRGYKTGINADDPVNERSFFTY